MLAFHDAMEGCCRGIEARTVELGEGRRRLREELARVRLDLPPAPYAWTEPPGRFARSTSSELSADEGASGRLNSFASSQESSRASAGSFRAPPARARAASPAGRRRHRPGLALGLGPIVQVKRVWLVRGTEPSGSEASADEQRRMMR